jgi:hypothetical protein
LQDEASVGAVNPISLVTFARDVLEHVVDVRLQDGIVGRIEDHVEIAHGRFESHDLGRRPARQAHTDRDRDA